jgi:hypothetical protein
LAVTNGGSGRRGLCIVKPVIPPVAIAPALGERPAIGVIGRCSVFVVIQGRRRWCRLLGK